ncbi:MAG: Hint domain-containing protein, partial [Gemmobacter sp.]
VIGYNVNNSNPTYATVEGLAFVGPPGAWPPVGVALTVVQASEGPGDFGQPRLPYSGTVVPCFTPGTRIRCPGGPRLIETLAPGDRVCVRGAGPQPLRALARTTVSAAMAAVMPQLAPVTIRAGAFGPGRPGRDLTVSPQHRILVRSARADLMFGTPEVLVAAVHLVDGDAIRQTAPQAVTYLHLVFESHQIVWAEGIETESFLPVAALSPGAPPNLEAEIRTLFPDLAAGGRQATVSRALSGWEARALVA